ncbi:MAG: hypothetical protein VX777_06290 [Chlamydiota bacterium]|nr:hypothetical protein [Chlamydiota bacterium]
MGQGSIPNCYQTISVPYVVGDEDGSLTAAIVSEIEKNGGLAYSNGAGQLKLTVKIVDLRDQNIGFRYDRDSRDRLTDSIIPTETRLTAAAEICLIECLTGKVLIGPLIISANVDFDHDFYSSRNGINIFSLGQLTDIDAARDSVKVPLNETLAKKIVEYINESW